MEKIIYCKTLDVHKNGVQFLLQGFETADKLSRVIEISLMASGDAIDFPLERIEAIMYVTNPNGKVSINKCTIKDNKVIYEVVPITEEGITKFQLKLIETSPEGATSVLASPKFEAEVSKSETNEDIAEMNATFTALEDAIAKAKTVYDERFLRLTFDSDYVFKAYYADGTVYKTDLLKNLFVEGNVNLAKSFAIGGSGSRTGEDTDNAKYYSNVARTYSESSKFVMDRVMENGKQILDEVRLHGLYTIFSVNFENGKVEYVSPSYKFNIDLESGELIANGQTYTFQDEVYRVVEDWLFYNGMKLSTLQEIAKSLEPRVKELETRITPVENGGTGADNVYDARTNLDVYSKDEVSTESTLGLFGLSSDNKPNTIFKMLGSHWWRRRTEEEGYALDDGKTTDSDFGFDSASFSTNIYYSDSVTVSEDGITLVNPMLKKFYFLDSDMNLVSEVKVDGLKGMYFSDSLHIKDDFGPVAGPYHNVFKEEGEKVTFVLTSNRKCTLRNATKYSPQYYEINGEWELLNSTNKDEYPEGKDGMFYYKYLGIPYKNAITGAKIQYGYYNGNGMYGDGNETKLTFNFNPKFVSINGRNLLLVRNVTNVYHDVGMGSTDSISVEWGENSVSLASGQGAAYQCNASGNVYYWVAIG